ncbi:hypothetical protein CNEO4_560001 [Clostridium neonatale]|nr:hypothetical protein CNEO4_560001 [Clostridium neonatale]
MIYIYKLLKLTTLDVRAHEVPKVTISDKIWTLLRGASKGSRYGLRTTSRALRYKVGAWPL